MIKTSDNFVLESAIFPGIVTAAALDELVAGNIARIELCCVPQRFDYHDPECAGNISKDIKSRGIAVTSVHLPFGQALDISNRDRKIRTLALDELKTVVALSMDMGADIMVIHPGVHLEDGENRSERLETAAASIRQLLAQLPSTGFTLAVENLPPGYLGETAVELRGLLDMIDDGRTGFCLDTGHAHLTGQMTALLQCCSPELVNIHVHDNYGDGDRHLPPGHGTIDWPALMLSLQGCGYAGPLTWEIVNEGDPVIRRKIMAQFNSGREEFWINKE